MRLGLTLSLFGLCSLALANPQGYSYDVRCMCLPSTACSPCTIIQDDQGRGRGSDDDSSSAATASSTASAAAASTTSSSLSSLLLGLKGDVFCSQLMCVGALVNGTSVQYTLQSLGSANLGWMAMGFGQSMTNSPMVIMWPNSDGSITLSQRTAPGEVMPTVDSSPPRVATVEPALSSLTGTNVKLAYTIAANSDTTQGVIWAYGTSRPSSAAGASIVQHIDSGFSRLDLTKTLASGSRDPTNPITTIGSDPTLSTPGSSAPSISIPLQPYQKKIVAHAILCIVGFLGFLPGGALLARYLRTYSPVWFKGHWILQFALAGPIIIIGVALGIDAVETTGTPHLSDDHMVWGVAVFALYFVQVALGAIIHYIKPKSFTVNHRRPAQNYIHAILGLLIIALSFYQVRTGYEDEWPERTGRGSVGNGANIVWYIWIVLLPVLYFAGLILLRRQYKQERSGKPAADYESDTDEINMQHRGQYRDEPEGPRY